MYSKNWLKEFVINSRIECTCYRFVETLLVIDFHKNVSHTIFRLKVCSLFILVNEKNGNKHARRKKETFDFVYSIWVKGEANEWMNGSDSNITSPSFMCCHFMLLIVFSPKIPFSTTRWTWMKNIPCSGSLQRQTFQIRVYLNRRQGILC